MFNFFEQPWTLLGASVIVLFGMFTYRSVWPERRKRWQLLVPLALAGCAFGLDALVATDLEKVHAVVRSAIRAVQKEDCQAVASLIAPDYHDSRHASKADLVRHCQEQLTGPTLKKVSKIGDTVALSGGQATVTLLVSLKFEPQSRVAQQHGVLGCFAKVQVFLSKQPDKRWLISQAELLEIDQIPVTWSSV